MIKSLIITIAPKYTRKTSLVCCHWHCYSCCAPVTDGNNLTVASYCGGILGVTLEVNMLRTCFSNNTDGTNLMVASYCGGILGVTLEVKKTYVCTMASAYTYRNLGNRKQLTARGL